MFNPIEASKAIKDEFISYISTLNQISDKDYANNFINELQKEGAITKGPFLELNDSFKKGKKLSELIIEKEISSLFLELEAGVEDKEKELQMNRELFLHQEEAIKRINANRNLIITTGTGSGKTECFIIPIINHLLREKENKKLSSGVRAILIYPMNALANDQMKRLRKLLKNYPDITFGVYNGDTKTIGFYQKKNNEQKNNDKNNNNWKIELNFIKIVVIIILFLIFISSVIIISYYFGKKCNLKRKKHANELDDNYEYTSPLPINCS